MIRTIIFDFNGIILNDEPLHFRAMRDAVAQLGITLTKEEYWKKYLPFDDARCLSAICDDHATQITEEQGKRILAKKVRAYEDLIRGERPLFPGAAAFITAAARRYPLAIASGARRTEVEETLLETGLRPHFKVVVAAEDFTLGKPHPESFLLALHTLNRHANGGQSIAPHECLVIEDAVAGVQGARAAGMACIAVANSYPPDSLAAANCVVSSLEEIDLDRLDSRLGT
jgi:HAD superfamily hydrolase (TIGR01509 family)